jgi:hypothetical protein
MDAPIEMALETWRARVIDLLDQRRGEWSEISRRAGHRPLWITDLRRALGGRRRGGEPGIGTLLELAYALGMSLGDLLGDLVRTPTPHPDHSPRSDE